MQNILVPTDFSAHSAAALERALEIASCCSGRLHLLHSYWVALSVGSPDLLVIPDNLVDQLREVAAAELAELEKRVRDRGIPCTAELSALPPEAAIFEAAEKLPADLIVMGTRGLTGLRHVFLGSVTERTVRLAPCPVMTVKGKEGEERGEILNRLAAAPRDAS